MARPPLYSMEKKAEVLALLAEKGLAAAAKESKVPKATISGWAKEAEVATVQDEDARKRTETATQVSIHKRRAQVDETKAELTTILANIAELSSRVERRILADVMKKLQEGKDLDKVTLRDIVGARTRAIHDLQLLTGEATERNDISTDDPAAIRSLRDDLRTRLEGA